MRKSVPLRLFIVFVFFALGGQSQLSPNDRNSERPDSKEVQPRIDGAGSLALDPLISAWIAEYSRQHTGSKISYRALGSKVGLRMLITEETSFGATDVPISDDQLASAKGRLLQLPVTVAAVVPVYNLPGVPQLRFSGGTLANIFLGNITKWNDLAIVKDNPGTNLPSTDIKVKHYFPNGSVETYVMADYLSKVSPVFKSTLATSSNNWPLASIAYKGGEGIAGFVSKTPGSIGYLGIGPGRLYEQQGSLKRAAVQNPMGEFVTVSPESLSAASLSALPFVRKHSTDFGVSITNAPGKTSYPIASFIWLILYEKRDVIPDERKKIEITKDFLKWVLTDGQKLASKLDYPALPEDLVQMELRYLSGGTISETEQR